MKSNLNVFLALVFLVSAVFGFQVHAAETMESESAISAPLETEQLGDKRNMTDVGIYISSINSGSVYTGLGLMHEFTDWFALGARGYLPMGYTQDAQVYIGQAFSRFYLLNDVNAIYLDAFLAESYFSGETSGALFASVGMAGGFKRRLTQDLSLGVSMAVEYASARISKDKMSSTTTVYNNTGVNVSYAF